MRKKGVTLIEILLVVTLSALLMVAIIPFIRSINDTWSAGSSKTEILQNGRGALEMLTRYIRQAPRITGIPGASGDYIKLRDSNDAYNIIFYHNVTDSPYYIGTSGIIKDKDLVMRTDSTGAYVDSLLASSLESLDFNFLQDDGSAATQANQVRSMHIEITLSDPLGVTAGTVNLETTVYHRGDIRITTPVWAINSGGAAPSYDTLTEVANDIGATGFRITNVASNCLSVNPIDGSCWVADLTNGRIKKISSSGELLVNLSGFSSPNSVSVNSTFLVNGRETVWVANTGASNIRRIYWNGASWVYDTISGFSTPRSVSANGNELLGGVDPRETCWVADTNGSRIRRIVWTGSAWSYSATYGGVSITNFARPYCVAVNTSETINGRNTCWVADGNSNTTYRVRKIYWTGSAYTYTSLSMGTGSVPRCVSPDTSDNTCWVANAGTNSTNGNRVRKIAAAGTSVLFNVTGFTTPYSVSVNPADGACWVVDYGHDQLVRLNAEGDEEFRISGFSNPMAVSVSPNP